MTRRCCGNWHHIDNYHSRITDTGGELCVSVLLWQRSIWPLSSSLCSMSDWCKVMCTNSTSALTKQGLKVQPSPKRKILPQSSSYPSLFAFWSNGQISGYDFGVLCVWVCTCECVYWDLACWFGCLEDVWPWNGLLSCGLKLRGLDCSLTV